MVKMLSTVFLILLVAASANAQEATKTTFKGTLDARGTKLRLEIDVVRVGKKLTGELRSLDQNNATLELSKLKLGDEFQFSVPTLGAKFEGRYNEKKRTAKGTFQQSGAKLPLTLTHGEWEPIGDAEIAKDEKLKEAWIGKLDMGIMKPVMQFRIIESDDKPLAYFDSITEGQTGFKASWSIKDDQLNFDVPIIKLTYRGKLNENRDEAVGTWSQGGREIELTVKKQLTEYDNENVWENRPQRPVAPFPYDAEEVTFENKTDGLTLAATLTIPKKPGKHPVVVLISGSGAQDRDESIMEHKPFMVLADYLTRRGIAVLRYDDRGTGKSTGDYSSATTKDLANDASAAVEFLKSHARINSKEIGLAGHSEGGLIAPIVCQTRDDVAFVALLAATGVDGATIITSQTEAMLRAEKTTPEDQAEIAITVKVNELVMKNVSQGLDFDDPEFKQQIEDLIQSTPESERESIREKLESGLKSSAKQLEGKWLKFFVTYDPRPALKNLTCPVLAIVGSKDLQVLPDLNMPEIKKALEAGGNKDFETKTLDGLNHLFQKCETGTMTEYATIQETFNPEALDVIGDWIIGHTSRVK